MLTRTEVMELVTWRSGRIGGAAGSITVGNGRFSAEYGSALSSGENRLPFGDEEPRGGNAQRGVVMKAAPASSLVVTKPVDPPAQLGGVDPGTAADGGWQRG